MSQRDLDRDTARAEIPVLLAATINSRRLVAACPDHQSIGVFLNPAPPLNLPAGTRLARQEPGAARRRKVS